MYSDYLQLLTALTVGLGLHVIFTAPPSPPHLPSPPIPSEWSWLTTFTNVVAMADSLSRRTRLSSNGGQSFSLPPDFKPLSPTEKYQPTVS